MFRYATVFTDEVGNPTGEDLEEVSRRVPYMADIPVLGRLFRFDTVRNTRKELLIIMTPFKKRSETSKVAPPHISIENNLSPKCCA